MCMMNPDRAMADAFSEAEMYGRMIAASKHPDALPPSTPEGIVSAIGSNAPTQVLPAHVEYDMAGFPIAKDKPSDIRRQMTCEAMANTLGVPLPAYAMIAGNPMLPTTYSEQANDKAFSMLNRNEGLFSQIPEKGFPAFLKASDTNTAGYS